MGRQTEYEWQESGGGRGAILICKGEAATQMRVNELSGGEGWFLPRVLMRRGRKAPAGHPGRGMVQAATTGWDGRADVAGGGELQGVETAGDG